MKKVFLSTLSVLITVILVVSGLAGCKKTETKSKQLNVVSTIFPGYDFARQVCQDNAEVTMLLPPGSESHSYEPSPQDIIKIQNSDLFIYVGGESDTWVDKILSSMDKSVKTIKMMDCVSVVEEESVEGMQAEEEESTVSDGEEEKEYDEHVWTSPKNAIKITQKIAEAMSEIDQAKSDDYSKNKDNYVSGMQQLDESFRNFFATVTNKTFIFGDRFPLRYFVEEYGLKYYAAFPGCSNETEPSAATIAFLINKVKSEKIGTVYYIEFSNHKVADSIAESTGAKTAMFHTCHNVSQSDINSGVTYVSLMQKNLSTLKETMK